MSQYGYVPPPSKRAYFFDSKKLQKKRDKEFKKQLEGQRQSSIQTQQNLMGRFGAQAQAQPSGGSSSGGSSKANGRINQHQSAVRSVSQIKRPASSGGSSKVAKDTSTPRIKRQNTSQQQKTIQTRRQGNAMTSTNRKAPAGKAPRVSAKGKTATATNARKAPDMRKTKTAPTVTKKTKIEPVKTAPQQRSGGSSKVKRVNPVQTAPSSRGVRPTEQTRPMAKSKVRVAEGTSAGLKKKKSY